MQGNASRRGHPWLSFHLYGCSFSPCSPPARFPRAVASSPAFPLASSLSASLPNARVSVTASCWWLQGSGSSQDLPPELRFRHPGCPWAPPLAAHRVSQSHSHPNHFPQDWCPPAPGPDPSEKWHPPIQPKLNSRWVLSLLLPKWLSLPTSLKPLSGFGHMLVPCPLHSVLNSVLETARKLPTHSPTKAPSGTSCRRGKSPPAFGPSSLHSLIASPRTHRAPHGPPELCSSFPPTL